MTKTNNELSYDTKTIIVVLTLIFVYPVGIILMYLWMKWNKLLKFVISLPIYLLIFGLLFAFLIGLQQGLNPKDAVDRTQCKKSCNIAVDIDACTKTCLSNLNQNISPRPVNEQ